MATDERTLILSLRKEILKVPRYGRATKAVRAAREQLIRHTKDKNILMGPTLNSKFHENGQQNPPTKVKVKIYKFKDKLVADTMDAPMMKEQEEPKKGMVEKVKETLTGKKPEVEEMKHEKQEEEKKEALKHPPEKKQEKKEPEEGTPRGKKAGERERKKSVYSKTQKPTHEKKK